MELLVHASAPGSRKDDDQYRSQAGEYMKFEPELPVLGTTVSDDIPGNRQHHVNDQLRRGPSSKSHDVDEHLHGDLADELFVNDTSWNSTTFLDDTQLAMTALESQIVSSAYVWRSSGTTATIHNARIIDKRRFGDDERGSLQQSADEPRPSPTPASVQRHEESARSASSDETPSSYLKSPVLNRSTREPREAQEPARVETTIRHLPLGLAQVGDNIGLTVARSRDEGQNIGTRINEAVDPADTEDTSQLPTSYSLSDVTTESSKGRVSSTQPALKVPVPACLTMGNSAHSSDPHSLHGMQSIDPNPGPSPPKANDTMLPPSRTLEADEDVVVTGTRTKIAVQESSQTVKRNDRDGQEVEDLARNEWAEQLKALPTSIYPPQPTTGVGGFVSHVTPTLHDLAETSAVANHYQPESMLRPLDPLERGHWALDAFSLPLQQQIGLWQYLHKLIRCGNAGWGVWCTRESSGTDSASLGMVKVFCWGEVVKHVYLLLYVASQSKIRRLGLKWIDSDGNVVIQMPGRQPT